MMENRCVVCGEIIPEGTMICPNCKPTEKELAEMVYNKGFMDGAKEFAKYLIDNNVDVVDLYADFIKVVK